MTLYVRAYADYSYEIIYLEGVFKKTRVHILVNPGRRIMLPGQADEDRIELNIDSLTHILTMETSIADPGLIDRTVYLAERTNKPIITNQETAQAFKNTGLSVRQLRIIGFEQEVVEGLHVDPVYLDELSNEVKPITNKNNFSISGLIKKANPFTWNPIKMITNTIIPGRRHETKEDEIDDSKPLAFHIELGKKMDILLPLDQRGVDNLDRILPTMDIQTVVIPNQDLGFTTTIGSNMKKLILLTDTVHDDKLLHVPKTHNPGIYHDTYYGGLEQWIEVI